MSGYVIQVSRPVNNLLVYLDRAGFTLSPDEAELLINLLTDALQRKPSTEET